jgi:hypothetical protein
LSQFCIIALHNATKILTPVLDSVFPDGIPIAAHMPVTPTIDPIDQFSVRQNDGGFVRDVACTHDTLTEVIEAMSRVAEIVFRLMPLCLLLLQFNGWEICVKDTPNDVLYRRRAIG